MSDQTLWCLGHKADFKKCDVRQDSLVFGTQSGFQEVWCQTILFGVWDTKRISRSVMSEKTLWCLGHKADCKKCDARQDSLVFGTQSGFQEV